MIPFINIHTHHFSKEDGVFLFNNRFGYSEEIFSEKYFSIGIHPWDSQKQFNAIEFEKWIQHPNCLAIGECGLDKLVDIDLKTQKEIFLYQLKLAQKYNKPVIIHCVKAFNELIEICNPFHNTPLIIHGFQKNAQLAEQLLKQHFYISFHNSFFKSIKIINEKYLEQIFLETDDNSHLTINEVYENASKYLKINLVDLKAKIYINFKTLFLNTKF
jgi:TatD DNase family protein